MNTWHALISSTIGGLIAGTFAILAQIVATRRTYKHNARLAGIQQQKKINGILQAIRYEFAVASDIYQRKAGNLLDKLEAGKPYHVYFCCEERYFLVYPNNTEIIGQIDDKDLCRTIIEAYNTANYVLEGMHVNNWYLDKLCEFRELQSKGPATGHVNENLRNYEQHLIDYAPGLKQGNQRLKEQRESLLARIDKYLESHPA